MSEKLKKDLVRILVSCALFFLILILDKSGVLPEPAGRKITAAALLYLIPWLLCGFDVLKKAVLGVLHGQMFDESFLMTLASIGAFVTGECGEAAAVMLFYQVGEWFQHYAVGRSRKSISELMDLAPESARIEREDGEIEEADPDDVEPGDILVILPGEKIPVDGTVISGDGFVETAALTGESAPVHVCGGDAVVSGCVNGDGLLRVRAEKAYEDSTVSKILELVEEASEKKSRTENFITRFAKYYTPSVVGAAVLLAVVPSVVTGNWGEWLYRACTFLVISCPCALVISVPLAFFGGVGAASRMGILVKGSNYLELLAGLKTVVSDKTGTLTEGRFRADRILPAEGVTETELVVTAAAVESLSTHPIALSVCEEAARLGGGTDAAVPEVSTIEVIGGRGIAGMSDAGEILAGNVRLLRERGIDCPDLGDGFSAVCCVARGGKYLGTILIRDVIKANAPDAVKAVKEAGAGRFVMLTGDRTEVAEAVGKEVGADQVFAELLPQDKVCKIEEMMADPARSPVAFIGDGINDAPVLMRSDVGIAMGSLGSDAAIEAADVVIMDDDLMRLPPVIRIAAKTMRIARENIVFALAVKLLILILGAAGLANMWAAVFSDVGVAVLCILNSMRLMAVKKTI